MPDYSTRDAVQFAMDGEATKFKSAVDSILMQKVADTLDIQKISMAQSMFADEQPEMESEVETEDEPQVEEDSEDEDIQPAD